MPPKKTGMMSKLVKPAKEVAKKVAQGEPLTLAALEVAFKNVMKLSEPSAEPKKMVAKSAPANMGFSVESVPMEERPGPKGTHVVTGRAYMGAVIAASGNYGLGLVSGVNPANFNDRLGVIGRAYEQYVYRKAKFIFVPTVGSSTAGQVTMTVRHDYNATPATNLQAAWDEPVFCAGPVWSPASVEVLRDKDETRSYFTDFGAQADISETEQFRFELYVSGLAANTVCGYVLMEYDIMFTRITSPPATFSGTACRYQPSTTTAGSFLLQASATSNAFTLTCNDPGVSLPGNSDARVFEFTCYNAWINNGSFTIGAGGAGLASGAGPARFWLRRSGSNLWTVFLTPADVFGAESGVSLYNTVASIVVLAQSFGFLRPLTGPEGQLTN